MVAGDGYEVGESEMKMVLALCFTLLRRIDVRQVVNLWRCGSNAHTGTPTQTHTHTHTKLDTPRAPELYS